MLSDVEFLRYALKQHKLSHAARQYLSVVRTSEPARRVGVKANRNVCSEFSSRKMGRTLQTESHTAERAFAVLCEYDERVIEIWDQAESLVINRTNKNKKMGRGTYFADFVLLTRNGPEIVEVKTEAEINELLSSAHPDWVLDTQDEVIYKPAVVAFEDIGLKHRVFVYKTSMQYLVANLELMLGSRRTVYQADEIKNRVEKELSTHFLLTLAELKRRLGLRDYTALVQLLDIGFIHFSIYDELLSFPENCLVALSKDFLAYAKDVRPLAITSSETSYSAISLSRVPTLRQAERTLGKLEKINAKDSCGRSVRRWRLIIKKGGNEGLTPFQSLIPRNYLSGNRRSRVNTIVADQLEKYIFDQHARLQGISLYRSHIRYCEEAKRLHPDYPPVSRKTFVQWLKRVPPEIIALRRGGRRAANAVMEPTDPKHRALVPQLAWQVASIDHYLADIYLICVSSNGVVYVMRPWITAMIDRCTSTVLALTISFRSPSKRACAKVIRDCIRRHGRLPAEIMVDRGSDFRSVYFVSLLSSYEITLSFRPPAHGRFGGADIEGFFGEFKKQWLSQRPGNLADYKEARAVDGAFSPSKHAVLRPADFYRELVTFCEWRDNKCRGIEHLSSQTKLLQSIQDFPFVGVQIPYDQSFLVASSVDTNYYKVDFQRGIHIDGQYYWSPEIASVRGKKRSLEVRIDPENPHVIYASIDNSWISCLSTRSQTYRAQDGIAQFVEGLLIKEAKSVRAKAKIDADEDLVRIVREMDGLLEKDNIIPAIEIEKNHGSKSAASIFSQIKTASISGLHREAWGQ